jgi:hypothetical protein
MTILDSQTPGLTRMFVVNAKPFSGRIEEIPLDSHTVFIAENGSGKTVMIKLLPLFYGEEPRDVVPSHEQCNFFGLYLPTVASYIAFEYVNHAGETRSVIMHSDPIGSALQYRFVRGPLAREMFLKDPDGEFDWVQSADLESHLREAGFPVSRRLVTSCRGYRSIIQGAPDTTSSASDRGFHAELAQDYGLGTRKARVREAYDAALQDAGLNTGAIARAEGEAADIRKRLRRADDARVLADSWGEQVRIERELPALEGRERAMGQDLRDASEARSVFISAAETRRNRMTREIGFLEAERERLTGDAASVATILRDHEGAEPARNGHVREGLAVNAAQLGTLKRALRESRDTLRARLTEIRSGFRKSGNEAISERLVGLREDEPEAMMADLTNWFETDHHEMLGMLMRGISSMVTPIQTAYNDLVMADREVSAIGKRLRRAIQDMPGFPHVTDVDLTIGSRLRDEPFWADLEAFDGALNAWQAHHDDARSAALVSAMTKLLEHWSDGRDPVIDFRNLLFIEGRLTEKGNERRFSRRTRLSELSSTGNVVILRLILFTALLTVMRQNRRIRFTWAVDEIGQLDPRNTLSLLQMLRANDIALVTAGPGLDPKVVPSFSYHFRITNGAIYLLPNPNEKAA